MASKPLRIIAVGRLKTPFWKSAAGHYLARLSHWRTVTETTIRDGDAALPPEVRSRVEGRAILEAVGPQDTLICLDERGKSFTSPKFAAFVAQVSDDANRVPCFVVGGAFGLDDAVRRAARHLIAFGPQTFPHELARVVLLEQLYRAEALLRNLPYHHA